MKLCSLLFAAWLALSCVVPAADQPNIILVLVDDMGWGDLSLNQERGKNAAPRINTPQLSKLAEQGAQLTRHYTCAPVCAPARASLFSGVHQGHAEVIRNNSFDAALEDSHTLASVLRSAGYATALIGKWGIGGGMEQGGTPSTTGAWPTARGFDYFFGYNNHIVGHRHYPKEEAHADKETGANAVWDGDRMITAQLDNCYSTDLFTARAKKWIVDTRAAQPDKPFFLALTLVAPHARLAVPTGPYPKGGGLRGGVQWLGTPGKMINTAQGKWDSFIYPEYRHAWEDYAKKKYGNAAADKLLAARRHATMITRIDDAVGDIMQLCRDLRIDKNTFLVFLSDNGPHDEPGAVPRVADHPAPRQDPSFFRSYGPLDGIKRDAWEGGLRVPCLVWAPGLVKAGLSSAHPSQFQDWMATFAELAGVPAPMRCDGVSLLPTLRGNAKAQKPGVVYSEYFFPNKMPVYGDYAPNKANRMRGEQQVIFFSQPGKNGPRWLKAIRTNISASANENFEIYDVATDTHEAHDLSASLGDKVQQKLKTAVLWNRRAYDYVRDPAAGKRNNPCKGSRPYDAVRVPANAEPERALALGLVMRRVQATPPWVPAFDTLPGAAQAEASVVADPAGVELPAGSVSEFTGFIRVPEDGDHWHFYLTLSEAPGTKAYVKMHEFQLVDADANYTPGSVATESAAANTVERIEKDTGKAGIPLKAGLHAITITVVQGAQAPGKLRLEWNRGQGAKMTPRRVVPAEQFVHKKR
ncbi:MAG: sulfatase-like hydrolase/transferase [Akkermansiaceae bacterium]|nr:sulfatase-like hydrolase/transferase [Akkermansiaceae bacterium]